MSESHFSTQASKTAVVVVNLGTPTAPTAPAVRKYLGEFLSDKRVVAIPAIFWKPLLFGIILPIRGPKSAEKYAQVWLPEGSPLAVYTERLTQAIGTVLKTTELADSTVVYAMRYGEPALAACLDQLKSKGIEKFIILPLYPQYSTTTTATVNDVLESWKHRNPSAQVEFIEDYSVNADWIHAVADSIHNDWEKNGRGQKLVFSFHGLPQRVARAGDPYPQRCEASAAAIANVLGLSADEWVLTYQSRFGKERWLEPSTEPTLLELVKQGKTKLDVVCPGFPVDCLETLEEVAIGFKEVVAHAGGTLRYIPCLNDSPAHADALAKLVLAYSK